MAKFIDLTGKRFGRTYVIRRLQNKGREPTWECKCDCGNVHRALGRGLRTGGTKSCGCLNRDQPKTHGKSGERIYSIWKGIINRCNGFSENTRVLYKDRGISVCERWWTFENFLEDMGEGYKEHVKKYGESNTTIDRIDGGSGYYPENCRWATYEKQSRNRRFENRHPGVTFRNGKWRANIGVDGSQIHLGTFGKKEDAIQARNNAEEKYWGDVR